VLKHILLVGSALSLAACSSLPSSGPNDQRILNSAAARLTSSSGSTARLQYALVDVDKSVIDDVPDYTVGSLSKSFGGSGSQPANLRIGIGDMVQLTVFESADGGLFIPQGGGNSTGNYVTFPSQAVDASGVINVPYVGEVKAVGLSVPELEALVAQKLAPRAIEPQVIAAVNRGSTAEISVLGDVSAPQRLPASLAGERVLDVLARAGGVKSEPFETFVSLTRRSKKATIYFNELVDHAKENIYVQAGDVIYVSAEQRTFTAFGSTGVSGQFNFGAESITLDQAVGKAGGLLDERANPRAIFLYRVEDRSVVTQEGVDLRAFPPNQSSIPTIYKIDLADPSGFFFAKAFPMRSGDVIYISNAPSVEVNKFLDMLQGTISTTNSAVTTARNSKDFVNSF
jgi:polysaccharide export outer membrane protein